MKTRNIFLLAFLSFPALASGHDLWLTPKKSPIRESEKAELLAISGMSFPASENLMAADRVALWAQRGPTGAESKAWESREEGTARCFFRPLDKAGTYTIGFATKPKQLAQAAKGFNEYLAHDGLPHVLEARKAKGIEGRDELEQYSKYAKTILQVGDGVDEKAPAPLGLRIEIVPEKNPLLLKEGEDLSVRVFFEGKALEGFLLQGGWEGMRDAKKPEMRTDSEGRAKLRLPVRGTAYLRGIHMTEVEGQPFRYESFWASLSFRLP